MIVTVEHIINNINDFLTNVCVYVDVESKLKTSAWNFIHGEWGWRYSRPTIKKDVYAIMPYFAKDGKIHCNKVIKGFIAEFHNKITFTSKSITGPYNSYFGKSIFLAELNTTANDFVKEYLANFMMFDNRKEAENMLNKIIKENENTIITNQINELDNKIIKMEHDIKELRQNRENLIKKLHNNVEKS